jgi:SnoaL-like protein
MPLDLPKPIAEYFAADHTRDAQARSRCFLDDGVVHDEGGTFRGTKTIRDWSAAARERYHHTVEPLSAIERDGATIVAGSGDRLDLAKSPNSWCFSRHHVRRPSREPSM